MKFPTHDPWLEKTLIRVRSNISHVVERSFFHIIVKDAIIKGPVIKCYKSKIKMTRIIT